MLDSALGKAVGDFYVTNTAEGKTDWQKKAVLVVQQLVYQLDLHDKKIGALEEQIATLTKRLRDAKVLM